MYVLIATSAVLVLDLVTKNLATAGVIGAPWLDPTVNTGLALGVTDAPAAIEVATSLAGLVIATLILGRRCQDRYGAVALGLIAGGSLGNLIDRVLTGAVRDFIVGPFIVFNVADVAIVLGIAFLLSRGGSLKRQLEVLTLDGALGICEGE